MSKLFIPENYLNLTLDEMLIEVIGADSITSMETDFIEKSDDYKSIVDNINAILSDDWSVEFIGSSEEDEDEWILEIGNEDVSLEYKIQGGTQFDDHGVVKALNTLFEKSKMSCRIFSYWDSEWEPNIVGFGVIDKADIPQLKEVLKTRSENDWHELFYC